MVEIIKPIDIIEAINREKFANDRFFAGKFVRVGNHIAMDGNLTHELIAKKDLSISAEYVAEALKDGSADVGLFRYLVNDDESVELSLRGYSIGFKYKAHGDDPARIDSINLLQEIFPEADVSHYEI